MFWKRKQAAANPSVGSEPTGEPTREPGVPLIAALLVKSTEFDIETAKAAIAKHKFGVAVQDFSVQKGILSFKLGDEMAFVAPMGAPYPRSDLEGPCQTSWMWPKGQSATAALEAQSHVLVTLIGGRSSPLARNVLLTRLTAALAGMPEVLAIYWPQSTTVHFPPVFTKLAAIASEKTPPLYLWVDARVFRNEGGTSGLFTTGMAPLGLMEFEVPSIQMPPGELREWAFNIAGYMIGRGAPIPDQNTIGVSAEQQLPVRHGPSRFGTKGTVMVIG